MKTWKSCHELRVILLQIFIIVLLCNLKMDFESKIQIPVGAEEEI